MFFHIQVHQSCFTLPCDLQLGQFMCFSINISAQSISWTLTPLMSSLSVFSHLHCLLIGNAWESCTYLIRSSTQFVQLLISMRLAAQNKELIIMFCSRSGWMWREHAGKNKKKHRGGIRTLRALSVLLILIAWRPEMKILTSDTFWVSFRNKRGAPVSWQFKLHEMALHFGIFE